MQTRLQHLGKDRRRVAGTRADSPSNVEERLRRALRRDPDPHADGRTTETIHQMMKDMAEVGSRAGDPTREIFARLGDKWSSLLLLLLEMRDLRYGTLKNLVGVVSAEGAISKRMCTLRLRSLERDGLVERRVIDNKSPWVTYSLTELGRGLVANIKIQLAWTRAHLSEIQQARLRFADQYEKRPGAPVIVAIERVPEAGSARSPTSRAVDR